MKYDGVTVTMPLSELENLRGEAAKLAEEIAMLSQAIEAVFNVNKNELLDRWYAAKAARSATQVRNMVYDGRL